MRRVDRLVDPANVVRGHTLGDAGVKAQREIDREMADIRRVRSFDDRIDIRNPRHADVIAWDANTRKIRNMPLTVGVPWANARYFGTQSTFGGSTISFAASANTLYASAFYCERPSNVDRIAIEVAVAGAGSLRMGVYRLNPATWLPDTLMFDAGTVSVSTTGVKEITLSPVQLIGPDDRQWYVAAFVTNVAVTLEKIGSTQSVWGSTSALSTSDNVAMVSRAFTYAALPATFGGSLTYLESGAVVFGLRQAT